MDGYVLSDSGVRVWTAPEAHPLLRHTDTNAHPAFRDKLAETYSTREGQRSAKSTQREFRRCMHVVLLQPSAP